MFRTKKGILIKMQNNKNTAKREIWLDALKILACFLVVVLHTVTYGLEDHKENLGQLLYYLGTLAIPIFFMVNGYLQLRREVDYAYVIKKILKIIAIVFIWNCLIVLVKFINHQEIKNVFLETVKAFLQEGYFYHFWFLGSLILIYMILPVLSKIFNNGNHLYKKLTAILMICCMLADIIIIRNYLVCGMVLKDEIIQTFRLWTWLMYFCIGGYIHNCNPLEKISQEKHFILMCLVLCVSVCYQYLFADTLYGTLYAESFYDNILIIITTILVFTFFKKLNFKNKKIIILISSLTMGVYIIHPTIKNMVIKLTKHFISIDNNGMNILMLIIIYGISIGISYCISKVPKVNKLIKL